MTCSHKLAKWLLILPKLSLEHWSLHNLRLMFSQCKSYDPHTFTVVCVSFICDIQYRNVLNHFPCYQADSIHGCSYNWLCLFLFVCLLCVIQKKIRDKHRMRSPGSSMFWKRKIWKEIHWMKVIPSDQAECQGFSFGWATVILARRHNYTALCFSFFSLSLSLFFNYHLQSRKDITKAQNTSRHSHMKIKQTDKTKYHIWYKWK